MKKFKIVKNKKAVYKNYEDIKKFDVVEMQFGDFDNFINAIILDISICDEFKYANNYTSYKIKFCYDTGEIQNGFINSSTPLELKVIGYAKLLRKYKEMDEKEY